MCGRFALTLAPASAIPAAVHSDATWADPGDAHAYVPRNTVNPTTHAPVAFRQPATRGTAAAAASGARAGGAAAAAAGRGARGPGRGHHDDKDASAKDGDGHVVVRFMRWGLVPSYMHRSQITQNAPLINARSETVLEKPSFRAIRAKSGSRRCVVITSGYYEWFSYPDPPGPARGRPPPKKLPYLIHADTANTPVGSVVKQEEEGGDAHQQDKPSQPKPLLLAGLYDLWNGDPGDAAAADDVGWSFAIVTMDSNPQISWLHSRMPVVLETEHAVRTWLDASCPPDKACEIVLAQSNSTKHLAWTRMVKDLSAPLPAEEQGKPKPPPKLAAIESFFASPGSKPGRKRSKELASAEETQLAPEDGMESRLDSVDPACDVESPVKRLRKESDAPSLRPAPHEQPEVEIVSSSMAERRGITSPLSKGFAGRKREVALRANASPTARPRASPKKPKDGKQRSIADFFKSK
jgi:putative SOS response-associated peptidase YedK